ncbi:v-cath [Palpita vitrealis nucleopolyhedrovirus]|uniref:Viral cathepsin n=1 Tax=Palpita vitrealis nucleopolyhedrovirus TaxID=2951960 RepID=A0AAE9RZ56_9ABAC|nr:v-cath [Palpita vitrealis nucleopolyhedrovirus]
MCKINTLLLYLFANGVVNIVAYDFLKATNYFEEFVQRFNKNYDDEHEKLRRFKIFEHNLHEIIYKNKNDDSAKYEINKFADLSKNEIISKYTGLSLPVNIQNFCKIVVLDDPPIKGPLEFDWRNLNKVTNVKNQDMCGACWAFATLSSLESQFAIKYNKLIDLSEQQMIDCDSVDAGCDGGLLHTAFEAIMDMKGLQIETDYPYEGINNNCRSNSKNFIVKIKDCFRYIPTYEEKLKDLLRTVGPIPMAIDAADILNYKHGIIKYCADHGLNHAVLLVGYGVENNIPYWTFKNTWGTDWGEDGFFRLQQNVNACGMKNDLIATATIE